MRVCWISRAVKFQLNEDPLPTCGEEGRKGGKGVEAARWLLIARRRILLLIVLLERLLSLDELEEKYGS